MMDAVQNQQISDGWTLTLMGLLTPRVVVGNPDQFLKVKGLMPLNHIFLYTLHTCICKGYTFYEFL